MIRIVLSRIAWLVSILVAATIVVFAIVHLSGDPINGFIAQYESRTWQYAASQVGEQGRAAATAQSGEQPVRSVKVAEFVALALQLAPPGIHVAAPELVWRAAQGDLPGTLRQWLRA